MKNLSLVLNVILLAAVGFLYYKTYSGKTTTTSSTQTSTMPVDNMGNRPPIAYIELDSLYENITYIRDGRKDLEAEQKAIETEWQNGYRGLEARKNEFLKKGAAITQDEAQQFQGVLLSEQERIDNKKQSASQGLGQKTFNFMEKIQKNLKDFLDEYNKEKKFMYIFTTGTGLDYMAYRDSTLNITRDVIQGMNKKK